MSAATDLSILAGLAFCLVLLAGAMLMLLFSYKPQTPSMGDRVDRMLRMQGHAGAGGEETEREDVESLRDRVLKPILDGINNTFLKMLPAGVMKSIQEKLDSAGNPGNLSPLEFFGIRL